MKRIRVDFSIAWVDGWGQFACFSKNNYFDYSDRFPLRDAKNSAVARVMKRYSKKFWVSIRNVYLEGCPFIDE